jgi:hypothetical protein
MRILRPSGAPQWFEAARASIEHYLNNTILRDEWRAPFRLLRMSTANLPSAADYEGAWLYDSTAQVPKFSDGADWLEAEPAIAAGSTDQYWRGDKSWQLLNGTAVANTPAGSLSAVTVQAALNELDTEKLAVSAYTAADILAKLLTVDGAGSGLDADLLDGQSSVFYLARSNHTGTQLAATISDFSAAADARVAAAVGVSVQAFDSDLTAFAALTTTGYGRGINTLADAAALRTYAGLVAIASSGSASDLTAGTVPAARMPALTGDVTSVAGAVATTLATVNSNVGSFGSATKVATFTVNAKGLTTAAGEVTITPAASSVTGGQALTRTNDTNVTLTLGGAPTTALLQAVSLTLGWAGQLAVSRGGTGVSTSTGSGSVVLSASPTLTGTVGAGHVNASGNVRASALFFSGADFTGMTGPGLIGYYNVGAASLEAWNFTTSTSVPIEFKGSTITLKVNGTTAMLIASTAGIDVAGEARCDTLRIDAIETVAAVVSDRWVAVNINGTVRKLLLAA